MEKNMFFKNFLSGIFFLGGIVLIFGIIFMIGKDKGLTQPKFKIEVLFKDVGGLIEGARVQLAGVNVGIVSDINFLEKRIEERRVKVEVSISIDIKNS